MTLADYFINNVQLQKELASDKNAVIPETMATSSRGRVWWRCEKGHEWRAAVDSRVYSERECPYCANQMVVPAQNDIVAVASRMEKLWHPTRNGDLKLSDITPGSRKVVWWQCENGHSWKASAYSVKAGTACPYCSGRNAIPGETDLATTHPQFVKMWSWKNEVTSTEVTAGSHKMVWWVCEKGHQWDAMVFSVVMEGSGCPYCAGKKAIPGETDLATLRPDLMEQWDYEKNNLNPGELTEASHDKAWWKCELGHTWQSMVFSRTREQSAGCPYCTGRKVLAGFNDLATLKPKLAQQWYQPLNGTLKPEDVTLGSNKKVWWQCSEGHVWHAFIYARAKKNGTGCPVCADMVKPRKSRMVEPMRDQKKKQPRVGKEKNLASINI